MKNIKKFFLLAPLMAAFVACDDEGDVFTGSPLDDPNIAIVPITAVIETVPAEAATNNVFLTDQKIPVKITLPRAFADTVQVEATSLSSNGRRRRNYIEFLPNETVQTGDVLAAGGDLFNDRFEMYASAIELYNGEPGKHYLLNSNVLTINSGNTTVPDNDVTKLQIKLSWPDAGSQRNNLRLVLDRPEPIIDASPTLQGTIRTHNINVLTSNVPGSQNGNQQSSIAGEYILKINAQRLVTSPSDMTYRLVINFPNDTVQVFQGVYAGLTESSPLLPVARIIKTVGGDGSVSFTAEQL